MKKIFEIIKKVLLSERLYKIILDISIVLLFGLSIFMLFVQSNIWTKIIMIGYSISIMIIIVFLRMPSILTETKFKKTSIWSFFTWNVCYSVIAGIIIGLDMCLRWLQIRILYRMNSVNCMRLFVIL